MFLIIAILAITVVIMFLRRFQKKELNNNNEKRSLRLTVCDTIAIDRTRYLVLIRRDNVEHLILVGGQKDLIIESNIIGKPITQKSDCKPSGDTQETITKTNTSPSNTEESTPFINVKEFAENRTSACANQNLEDSEITATIEGRQEPSLFIPDQKNKTLND
ncbi:hypothetical protein [Bartonella sp. F02]|uniref:hypothetical protein n=1 Tax=Bartonella sp. F02 TaxID=2967262 RepID=UPI002E7A25FC|nr:hypothetical protein [Bartonella sp. F02]